MLSASPITNQSVGKTFGVAISVLGVGAVLQLVLIGWAFVNRTRLGLTPTPVVAVAPGNKSLAHIKAAQATPATLDLKSNPLFVSEPPQTTTSAPTNSAAVVSPAAPTAAPKPTPVTAKASPTPEPVNRFDELIVQGRQLRDRGDMSTAITKFREAAVVEGKSPIPLHELAITYDKMGLADKAAEQWRKIYDMGDAAGIYHEAAEAKIKMQQAAALRNVEKTAPPPDTPVDISAAIDGIAAGATLGLLQITSEDQRDPDLAKRITVHIPVKARPNAHVDVRDLVILVLFYDIVDGQNVVQTSAEVGSRWATPPADWTDSDTEELTVEYRLPKPEPRAAKRDNRKYFGYIVRIYYKQQLQAATAEPERLAQQYPPPPTLPKENEK